jgi:signal transduction histidine kinase
MNRLRLLLTFIFVFGIFCTTIAQPVLSIKDASVPVPIGKHLSIYIDSNATYTADNILTNPSFELTEKKVPVFNVTPGNIWAKFSVVNQTSDSLLFLNLQYANISFIEMYKLNKGKLIKQDSSGNALPFVEKKNVNPYYLFLLHQRTGDTATYYVKVNSSHPVLLPFFIENRSALDYTWSLQSSIIGIYIGIILAIFFYNFFLFLSTRDKSYLIYVLYLLFIGLAQITLAGYGFKYLWPSMPAFNTYALTVTSALAGITGISFALFFLKTKEFIPRFNKFYYLLIGVYVIGIILSFSGNNSISYSILNVISLLGGLSLIAVSAYIAFVKKYKPATFYFIAWLAFLGGMIVFVLRNLNVLPYNNFTTYILYVGSAIEAILLSIALADKINVLRKEKEFSQARELEASLENQRLIKEQNITLEQKVKERTEDLETANSQLNVAFRDLKDTQTQLLVEAEKMASLGQLTAGIAHEINNPINFVKSNIKPLQLDFNDLIEVIDAYGNLHKVDVNEIPEKLKAVEKLKRQLDVDFIKTEIVDLMRGIEDGAERTAEIVKGLRTFSRLDEREIKTVDIHEGIDSTLVIVRNTVPYYIKINKEFRAQGRIECFPGKLNQVFMNILNNAVQAITMKSKQDANETVTISTDDIVENGIKKMQIKIKDSGMGMTEEVKHKIFDPFFTTKDVGSGTGLGLSIVFKIIQKHHGTIEVNSEPGKGSEFVLTLFHTLPGEAVI